MRVLIAPDDFTGTLSAAEAAHSIAAGWARQAPADQLDLAPMSDGGPGFASALAVALSAETELVRVRGPLGDCVDAALTYDRSSRTAYVESAATSGLALIPPSMRDPRRTTSWGLGEAIEAALRVGALRIVVGLGGTAVCDGGSGMLAALGATAVDAQGRDATGLLDQGGSALAQVTSVDLDPVVRRLEGVDLRVATDVDCPLLGPRGAAHGFAAQKGADAASVAELEAAMEQWARALGRVDVGGVDKEVWVLLGAGAGGGIGSSLLALGAARESGIGIVVEAARLSQRVGDADLVITGEGAFDWQSLRGKVVSGVAEAALAQGRPVVVLAGRVEVGRREWSAIGVSAAYSLSELAGGTEPALADAAGWLERAAERAARSWSRGLNMPS